MPKAEPKLEEAKLEVFVRIAKALEDITRELGSIDASLMGGADIARQTSQDLTTALGQHTGMAAALDALQRRFHS